MRVTELLLLGWVEAESDASIGVAPAAGGKSDTGAGSSADDLAE